MNFVPPWTEDLAVAAQDREGVGRLQSLVPVVDLRQSCLATLVREVSAVARHQVGGGGEVQPARQAVVRLVRFVPVEVVFGAFRPIQSHIVAPCPLGLGDEKVVHPHAAVLVHGIEIKPTLDLRAVQQSGVVGRLLQRGAGNRRLGLTTGADVRGRLLRQAPETFAGAVADFH